MFGGTFDPVHRGHIETVVQVQQMLSLDSIRLLPAAVPPHRPQPGATPDQRLEMVRLAVTDFPSLLVDPRELQRQGPSYTFDTVESLRRDYPNQAFCLILGADAALGLDRWYRWQELIQQLPIVVMVRPGWPLPEQLPGWWQETQSTEHLDAGKITVVNIQPLDISATAIRNSIKSQGAPHAMLDPAVWHYIQSNRLYE